MLLSLVSGWGCSTNSTLYDSKQQQHNNNNSTTTTRHVVHAKVALVVAVLQPTALTGGVPLSVVLKEQRLLVHIVHCDVHIHTPVNRTVGHCQDAHLQGTTFRRQQTLHLMLWQVIQGLNECSVLLPVSTVANEGHWPVYCSEETKRTGCTLNSGCEGRVTVHCAG